MEAQAVQALQFSSTLHSNLSKPEKTWPNGSLRMFGGFKKQPFVSSKLQSAKPSTNIRRRTASLVVACSNNNVPALTLESGSFPASVDEKLILKSKTQEIEPYLNGRCIYLVGMMGSGKTTVGRILSRELSYSFFDRFLLNIFCIYGSSDELVKEEVDGTSVADIFKLYGEPFFRNKETEVLQKLSLMHRHVISTGGGAVLMPNNWKFMRRGISVWLDVPVEALAQRITAVGTDSRPLLHSEAGNAYMETVKRLSIIREERSEAYANANARVSLENMAAKLGQRDVSDFSPTAIAMETLEQVRFLCACQPEMETFLPVMNGMVHSKTLGRTEPNGSPRMSSGFKEQVFVSSKLRPARPSTSIRRGTAPIEVTCLHNNAPGCCKNCSYFDNLPTSKSQEIEPYLNGGCIYLVGMMGSGKTTVGKILSQVLSYLFFDSDALVEVDGTSVADIFKHIGEPFFGNKTEVLRRLSMIHRHIISTGGGAVEISVWLDVPLKALGQRITAVGTDSRPLLHYEEGDAYTKKEVKHMQTPLSRSPWKQQNWVEEMCQIYLQRYCNGGEPLPASSPF
ncbi:Shikimate kinase, chloroplastic [Glycine soja]